jgi:hypothetical protein
LKHLKNQSGAACKLFAYCYVLGCRAAFFFSKPGRHSDPPIGGEESVCDLLQADLCEARNLFTTCSKPTCAKRGIFLHLKKYSAQSGYEKSFWAY